MDTASTSMSAIAEPTGPAVSEAQRIEQMKETVSASRLTLFLQCRLKFFFRYVLKLKKPKTAALHLGGAVHATLKASNKARWKDQPLTLKELHDEFAKAWEDESEGPVDWDDNQEEQKSTAWRLLETYIRQVNPTEKPDAVEVPVEADLREHGLPTVLGILDLVERRTIIDYKASGQTPNPEKVAHASEVQTSVYSLLYRENTGKTEAGIELHHLVKLKTPKIVVTAVGPATEQQQTRLFHVIDSYVNGLDRRDFIPSPGLQCVACEFFNECRAWH